MRRVGLNDLHHAACAVQSAAKSERHCCARQLVWRAHVADKYVKRLRKLHPNWGDGSLREASLRALKWDTRPRDSQEYRRCMSVVLEALEDRENAISQ